LDVAVYDDVSSNKLVLTTRKLICDDNTGGDGDG
jgi:hypothetical protein